MRKLRWGGVLDSISLSSPLWPQELVADLIRRDFEIKVSPAGVGRIPHQPGMSPQRPVDRAGHAHPSAVQTWKATAYPEIMAAATRQDATLFLADEA